MESNKPKEMIQQSKEQSVRISNDNFKVSITAKKDLPARNMIESQKSKPEFIADIETQKGFCNCYS